MANSLLYYLKKFDFHIVTFLLCHGKMLFSFKVTFQLCYWKKFDFYIVTFLLCN